jgi:hypothetical protein
MGGQAIDSGVGAASSTFQTHSWQGFREVRTRQTRIKWGFERTNSKKSLKNGHFGYIFPLQPPSDSLIIGTAIARRQTFTV